MAVFFKTILYQPIFNALVFLYNYLPGQDLGLAIIALTFLIRLVLLPLFYKSAKDQTIMQKLAPKIKAIQESHKDDKQKQTLALLELYREHKVNPFSQFLLLFIQLPILIALYRVFWQGITEQTLANLYSFVSKPEILSHQFLRLIDLGSRSWIIVGLAVIAQYFQGRLSLAKTDKLAKDLTAMERMSRQMVFVGPLMTILFLSYLPAAVGLYWLTTSVFSIIQQIIINKKLTVSDDALIAIDKKLHHQQ